MVAGQGRLVGRHRTDKALERLCNQTGPISTGYYEKHREIIHAYFHKRSLSLELARVLKAPIEQVHPDEREDLKTSHEECKEDGEEEDEDENDGGESDEGRLSDDDDYEDDEDHDDDDN